MRNRAGVLAAVLASVLAADAAAQEPPLVTETTGRASGIPIAPDERLVWGNLVVRATGPEPVTLRRLTLRNANPHLKIVKVRVADGTRPQSRLLVWGERDLRRLRIFKRFEAAFHPLPGYVVHPVADPDGDGLTADRRFVDTEIVIWFRPIGRRKVRVTGGVRVHYTTASGVPGFLDLPNQLTACAPDPCRVRRPKGW